MPFLHFFDGFRTSHEVQKIEQFDRRRHARHDRRRAGAGPPRARACRPIIRCCAARRRTRTSSSRRRETVQPVSTRRCPAIVQKAMDQFAELAGRQYHLFDYVGAPDAERVIVMMGSGAETAHETVEYLNARGEKVGVLKVRLYRPVLESSTSCRRCPSTVKSIAVLDRTKEPGARASRSTRTWSRPWAKASTQGWAPFKAMPHDRRRPLRPVVEGVHAGHGQGRLRRAGAGASPRTTSPSASTTT